jgi:excisionase family DNA binding protein
MMQNYTAGNFYLKNGKFMTQLMMSTKEVAEYLDIHEKQVYALIKEKKIPCTRVTGKWVFPKNLIDEWIEQSAASSIEKRPSVKKSTRMLLAAGSNDPVLDVLLGSINLSEEYHLFSTSTGSTEGLRLLGDKSVDIAWCHLLDPGTGEYNIPYLSRHLSNMEIAVIHLFYRELGFISSKTIPKPAKEFSDLAKKGTRFINRQAGSGTRVLLDYYLGKNNIDPASITGYKNEVFTHFETGLAIASGEADAGIATVAIAKIFGLPFSPITSESFDMVLTREVFFSKGVQAFIEMLNSEKFRNRISSLGKYDFKQSGKIIYSAP